VVQNYKIQLSVLHLQFYNRIGQYLCSMKWMTIGLLLLMKLGLAQNSFQCIGLDSISQNSVPGAIISIVGTSKGAATDMNGHATVMNIPNGTQTVRVMMAGYATWTRIVSFPTAVSDSNRVTTVYLQPSSTQMEEVVVTASRTNSRIEDLNIKVEVLGEEEMDEESSMVPAQIGSILGDLSIITIQRTNPVSGNDVVRMQGLDARYTQIMRDGFPLYSGFSGSLGVLSIPPLDLKQVEIIKGSASTLYGGGAIGGMINFVSKTPSDTAITTILINGTSLGESNFNFYTSGKKGRAGVTVFAAYNSKLAIDVNKDGFTDVPSNSNIIVHPRFFFDLGTKTNLIVGLQGTIDNRMGGDLKAMENQLDTIHTYTQQEDTKRFNADISFTHQLNNNQKITFKSAANLFRRKFTVPGFALDADQISSYSELSDLLELKKHTLIFGLNLYSELFRMYNSSPVFFYPYSYFTGGLFVQDDWQITKRVSISSGIRVDYHSRYKEFILPRVSLFFKPNDDLSIRLAAGTGYKTPGLFDFTLPSSALTTIPSSIEPDHSYGINADINYIWILANEWELQLNQAFYYTHIPNPVQLTEASSGLYVFSNTTTRVNSYGTDSYFRLSHGGFELYMGYNHTESYQTGTNVKVNTPFNPKDKMSFTIAYDTEAKWRGGVEASWSGNQYIENNFKVKNYWFAAAMVQYRFKRGSIVLNCENVFDVRQSKWEAIVNGPTNQPVFKPLWAPTEGRVINLSFKMSF
jgi:outer membrane receptor for ferrienterochelin and colicins